MHVQKLRIGADDHGFIPAGQYFARLAKALREANVRDAKRTRPGAVLNAAPVRH